MRFERAKESDAVAVAQILNEGVAFLKAQGIDQWQTDPPTREEVLSRIARGEQYLLRTASGEIAGVCSVQEGDGDYAQIEGDWKTDGRYFAVHRVAVTETWRGKGVPKRIYDGVVRLAKQAGVRSLRADTHPDNKRMQATFEKNGFVYCGVVYLKKGGKRLAYERMITR